MDNHSGMYLTLSSHTAFIEMLTKLLTTKHKKNQKLINFQVIPLFYVGTIHENRTGTLELSIT